MRCCICYEYRQRGTMWRPFEPSKDEQNRIECDKERNQCNLHKDCAEADEKCVASGGRWTRATDFDPPRLVYVAFHCSYENCEDCFGC